MSKRKGSKANGYANISLPRDLTEEIRKDLDSALANFDRCINSMMQYSDWHQWGRVFQTKHNLLRDRVWSKYVSAETLPASEREAAAITKWLSSEVRNGKTNERLSGDNYTGVRICGRSVGMSYVLEIARRLINDVVGRTYPEDILKYGQFTNGASTRLERSIRTLALKYLGKPHATSSMVAVVPLLERMFPAWARVNPELSTPEVVESSVMFTVPKNAVIDRVACKEPEINMFVQRSIGLFLRRKLQWKTGIDLRDQTRNQYYAKIGSNGIANGLDMCYDTLDLSSASDTVSYQLVKLLLPHDWFVLMDECRVKSTDIHGKIHHLNMFSSMGNGFTFELETLIFWALSKAVCVIGEITGDVTVYGDDIVVPMEATNSVITVLTYCGFIPNKAKSYKGHKQFTRESCGKFFHRSEDVTPFYIRRPITTVVELIHFLNSLRDWATGELTTFGFGEDFARMWRKYKSFVPSAYWGGKDTTSVTSLVTVDAPRKRLMPVMEKRRNVQKGALLWWLHRSGSIPMETSDVTRAYTGKYYARKNRVFGTTVLSFEKRFPDERLR